MRCCKAVLGSRVSCRGWTRSSKVEEPVSGFAARAMRGRLYLIGRPAFPTTTHSTTTRSAYCLLSRQRRCCPSLFLLADRPDKHDEHYCSARAQDRTQVEGFAVTRNSMNALKTLRADGPETDMLARGLDWSHVEDAACCETRSRRFYILRST